MNNLILLAFLIGFLSCTEDRIQEPNNPQNLMLLDDTTCVYNLNFDINGTTVYPYRYIKNVLQATTDFSFNYSISYFCPCTCAAYDTFKFHYRLKCANYGITIDTNQLRTCSQFYDYPGLDTLMDYICLGNKISARSFLINNLHHAVDSEYINPSEKDLAADLINAVFTSSSIDLCDYVSRWDTLTKKSPGNGLFTAVMIGTLANIEQVRMRITDHYNLDPDTNENMYHKFWACLAFAVASLYENILTKGCAGLKQGDAGNMLFRDAGHAAAEGAVD